MRVCVSVLCLLQLLSPQLALGWGGEGHQLIALIAEEQLTPSAQRAVKDLLDGGNISDAEVINWADQIRRERRDTAPWHYVNIPHDAAGYDAGRDARKGSTIIDALERQAKILADRSQPREQRVEALKFVVHFVGDLHQPLHTVDRNGDRGGNSRLVFFLDRRKAESLYAVWDTALVRDLIGRRKIIEVADRLGSDITPRKRREWTQGSIVDWANESHRVAGQRIYAEVPADGPPPRLGTEYVERAQPVVMEQIQRDGVRLAMLLNQHLK